MNSNCLFWCLSCIFYGQIWAACYISNQFAACMATAVMWIISSLAAQSLYKKEANK